MIRARVFDGIHKKYLAVKVRYNEKDREYFWEYFRLRDSELEKLPILEYDIYSVALSINELAQLPQTDEVKILAMKIALGVSK